MSDHLCGLTRTAVILSHARATYYAVLEFYALDGPLFEVLPIEDRHRWCAASENFLQLFMPVQAAETRPPLGSDVPVKETSGGDGVSRPGSLFDRIATVARAEAASVLAFRGLDDSDGRD
jgi:hypothetical protein